jgi:nucleoside-diphosphate-sugar epimerase
MLTWIVTGASGFVGSAVLRTLESESPRNPTILALARLRPPDWPAEQFLAADLSTIDPSALAQRLSPYGPLAVVHAAGRTPPADPRSLFLANTRGTDCLLQALALHSEPSRVVLVGSAAELGPVPADRLPSDEQTPCRPTDSYSLCKWAATQLGLADRQSDRLSVMVGRLFNPIGPGLPASQVFGRLAARMAEAPEGLVELTVGNLQAARDFFDVRDAAEALIALVREGRPGRLYHIGSGRSHSVGAGLGHLIRTSGLGVLLHETAVLGRSGPSDSCAAIDRIVAETSWRPRIPFEQSLDDLWAETLERSGRATQPRRVA